MITDEIKKLNLEINNCSKCRLNCKETGAIIARTSIPLKLPIELMIIAEAGGAEEFEQKKVLVGKSGKLVDEWLKIFNINSYILVNVVKNRPTDAEGRNRTPDKDEIDACLPYLHRQIELLKPKNILVLGNTAYKALLPEEKENITNVINKKNTFYINGIKTYVYLHPSYLLRYGHPWQKEIAELSTRMFGTKEKHGKELFKYAGIASAKLNEEIENTTIESDKFEDLPIIGLRTDYSFGKYGGKFNDTIIYLKKNSAKYIGIADENTNGSFLRLLEFYKSTEGKIIPIYGFVISNNNFVFSIYIKDFDGFRNGNKILSYNNTEKRTITELTDYINQNKFGLKLVILPNSFSMELKKEYEDLINVFDINDRYLAYIPTNSIRTKVKYDYLKNNFRFFSDIIFQDNMFDKPEDYEIYCAITAIKNHSKFEDVVKKGYNSDRFIHSKEDIISIVGNDEFERLRKNTVKFAEEFSFVMREYNNLLPNLEIDWQTKLENYMPSEEEIKKYQKENEKSYEQSKKELCFERYVFKNFEENSLDAVRKY